MSKKQNLSLGRETKKQNVKVSEKTKNALITFKKEHDLKMSFEYLTDLVLCKGLEHLDVNSIATKHEEVKKKKRKFWGKK